MVVRNSDLILSSDKSLRMTSLLEVKHNEQSSSTSRGTFKELVSDALDFDIAEIILNPTGKLVAVVGSHKIVVVVLPRSGVYSSKSVGAKVSVKAATVGNFYYHEMVGGRARLASVKWHPWGHLGSSLLVMSKDGLLRWVFDSTSRDLLC
jgi:nucleoporin NUP82